MTPRTEPRPEVVALLTATDPASILLRTYCRHDSTPLTAEEAEAVLGATLEEVQAARDVLARRLALRSVGGGGDAAA